MNGSPDANCSISRPRKRRHKRDSPWLPVMARLWKRGWSARRIAAALSDLSARACRHWLSGERDAALVADAADLTDDEYLDALLAPGACDVPWTARQVRHWMMYRGRRRRRREGQPRRRPRPPHPDERGCDPRRRYASKRGWLHALPAWEEGAGWVGGVELSRRDVDVLCCLRDHGPLTRAQLADSLQLQGTARRLYNRRGRPILAKLRRAGLVEVTGWRDCRPLYGLRDSHRGSPQPRDAANERS